jgi:outer membrane autotransporter protein
MPMNGFRIGPIAALDYASAKVDGYTEAGDAALTLNVGKQSLKSLTGQLGFEARTGVDIGAAAFRPFVSAAVEHDFTGDDRAIRFAQTSAPTIVNTWNVDGRKETYARFSGGASANVIGAASLNVAVSATVGRDSGDELGAQLGLRLGF